jgi:NTP pyrophosphatase (non-canonical NTP hydrolase)
LRERRLVGALGLAGEAGEVADLIKKFEGHGHPVNLERLAEELGDLLWCISNVATLYDLELSTIAAANIEKLLHRYPNGFDASRSKERDEKE